MSDLTTPLDGSATLGGVLDGAGPTGIRMLTAPAGLGVPVRGTVIYDAGDRIAESPGGLLLLVGVDPSDPRALALPAQAAARGCTVAVIKRRGQDMGAFVGAAERHGVAVLAAEDDLPWRNIDAVLSCALTGAGTSTLLGAVPMGGELYALTDHLASVVGGAAVVEDLARRVIAYSSVPGVRIDAPRKRGILQRRIEDLPELPLQRRQYQRVLAAQTVVRFPAMGAELPRAAVAVRAGTLPLGTLWVIEPEGGISEEGVAALSETARLVAPHLLRLLNLPEAERRLRRETFLTLLDSGAVPEEACSLLGIRTGVPFRLLAFAPPGTAAGGESSAVSTAALATASTATSGCSGSRKGRGASGSVRRRTPTAAATATATTTTTTTNAISVPRLVRSASCWRGTKAAGSPTPTPTIPALRAGVCRLRSTREKTSGTRPSRAVENGTRLARPHGAPQPAVRILARGRGPGAAGHRGARYPGGPGSARKARPGLCS
ncbi:hypothetical protein [Streptomyces sp. NBC_01233]|uniref:hypothetical protein n=1 Tax=Streptomyces sp. NBC_01233 TaxID=2903787 RepID=UPI002E100235|nr:hypothetical protein OG332_01120 [Streptomyces sp. NBC_01233]